MKTPPKGIPLGTRIEAAGSAPTLDGLVATIDRYGSRREGGSLRFLMQQIFLLAPARTPVSIDNPLPNPHLLSTPRGIFPHCRDLITRSS